VIISSNVTERVERVLFDDGMSVTRGQLLASSRKPRKPRS
jgi:multidrug resistance efflux pump